MTIVHIKAITNGDRAQLQMMGELRNLTTENHFGRDRGEHVQVLLGELKDQRWRAGKQLLQSLQHDLRQQLHGHGRGPVAGRGQRSVAGHGTVDGVGGALAGGRRFVHPLDFTCRIEIVCQCIGMF